MHIQLLGVTALQRTSELQNSSSKVRISATFLGETEFAINPILQEEQKANMAPTHFSRMCEAKQSCPKVLRLKIIIIFFLSH